MLKESCPSKLEDINPKEEDAYKSL